VNIWSIFSLRIPDIPEPVGFELLDCYPNPFNSGTTITVGLKNPVRLTIRIYDTLGRCVRILAQDEALSSGFYHYEWQGKNDQGIICGSGMYYIMASQGDEQQSRKVILLK
jgi:flagellar hook assembly protein FlgD